MSAEWIITCIDVGHNSNAHHSTKLGISNGNHKSAITHAGTVFVPRELNPTLHGFPGLTVERFYVRFRDPRCSGS